MNFIYFLLFLTGFVPKIVGMKDSLMTCRWGIK